MRPLRLKTILRSGSIRFCPGALFTKFTMTVPTPSVSSRWTAFLSGLLLIILGLSQPAQSQDTSGDVPPDTSVAMQVEMSPIEVTAAPFQIAGEAASFAVTARERTELELNTTPSLSLERIADGIPGLFVGSREHYALGDRITIRGLGWRSQFGVRGIQVLLDGIPLTVADGQAMVGIVDPSFVRSIEVIRGPASTFWGNASGGVLALSTKADPSDHFLRTKVTAGSFGFVKTDVQVTPDVGPHRLSMFGSYLGQEGYRDNSQTRLSRFGATSTIRLSDDSGIQTIAALQFMPRAQNPSTLDAEAASENPRGVRDAVNTFNTGKTVTQGQLGATYFNDVGVGRLRTTAYGIFRELENPIPFGYIDLSRRVVGTRVTLEGSRDAQARGLEWGIGVEGKIQRDDRSEFGNSGGEPDGIDLDQLETVDNAGVFGRASLPVGPLRLSAGVRYDRMQFEADDRLGTNDGSRTFDTVSPSVGVSVDVGTNRIYANLASGLEAPTANELSNRPDGSTGFNLNLDPENIWGLETGIEGVWVSQAVSYDLAVFGTRITDLLVPQEGADEQTFFRNAGETRHIGVETALRWAPRDALRFRGSYTYVRAQFTDAQTADGTSLNGNAIPGVPPHMFSGSVQLLQDRFTAEARVNGLGSYEVNSLNTAQNDAYALLDLSIGAPTRVGGVTASPFFAVQNVFDTRYNDTVINAFGGRFYEPAAGRTYRVGVSMSFN